VDDEVVLEAQGRRGALEPANKQYPSIVAQKRMRIAAVVIAVIRKNHA